MTSEPRTAARRGIQIHADDNVATLLESVSGGPVLVYGPERTREVFAVDSIAHGHKIALTSIPSGAPVVKFGVLIGLSTAPIQAGEWVHLHNCRSRVDERSSHLDLTTGATKDTPYA